MRPPELRHPAHRAGLTAQREEKQQLLAEVASESTRGKELNRGVDYAGSASASFTE